MVSYGGLLRLGELLGFCVTQTQRVHAKLVLPGHPLCCRGFTTLSVYLGHMLVSLHKGLLHAIQAEQHAAVLAPLIRALCAVCSVSPYDRLPGTLLPELVATMWAAWKTTQSEQQQQQHGKKEPGCWQRQQQQQQQSQQSAALQPQQQQQANQQEQHQQREQQQTSQQHQPNQHQSQPGLPQQQQHMVAVACALPSIATATEAEAAAAATAALACLAQALSTKHVSASLRAWMCNEAASSSTTAAAGEGEGVESTRRSSSNGLYESSVNNISKGISSSSSKGGKQQLQGHLLSSDLLRAAISPNPLQRIEALAGLRGMCIHYPDPLTCLPWHALMSAAEHSLVESLGDVLDGAAAAAAGAAAAGGGGGGDHGGGGGGSSRAMNTSCSWERGSGETAGLPANGTVFKGDSNLGGNEVRPGGSWAGGRGRGSPGKAGRGRSRAASRSSSSSSLKGGRGGGEGRAEAGGEGGAAGACPEDKAAQHAVKLLGDFLAAVFKIEEQREEHDDEQQRGEQQQQREQQEARQLCTVAHVHHHSQLWLQLSQLLLRDTVLHHTSDVVRAAALGSLSEVPVKVWQATPLQNQQQLLQAFTASLRDEGASAVRAVAAKGAGVLLGMPGTLDLSGVAVATLPGVLSSSSSSGDVGCSGSGGGSNGTGVAIAAAGPAAAVTTDLVKVVVEATSHGSAASVRINAAWAMANVCDALRQWQEEQTEQQEQQQQQQSEQQQEQQQQRQAGQQQQRQAGQQQQQQSGQQQQQQEGQLKQQQQRREEPLKGQLSLAAAGTSPNTGADGAVPPVGLLSLLCPAAVAAAASDSEKVRPSGVRALGQLLAAWQPSWATATSTALAAPATTAAAAVAGGGGGGSAGAATAGGGAWLSAAIESLKLSLATGSMKAQWNACYAVGSLLGNAALRTHPTVRRL